MANNHIELLRYAIVLVLITGLGLSLYGRHGTIYRTEVPTIILIDYAVLFLLAASNLASALTLCRKSSVSKFQLFHQPTKFVTRSAYMFFAFGLMIASGACYLSVAGWAFYKYHIYRDVNFLFYCAIIYNLHRLAGKLSKEFLDLNQTLETVCNFRRFDVFANALEVSRLMAKRRALKTVREVSRRMNKLLSFIETLNRTFAPMLILAVMHLIVGMLRAVVIMVQYGIKQNTLNGNKVTYWVAVIYPGWFLAYTFTVWLLASAGQKIENQISSTNKVCFNIINASLDWNGEEDQQIHMELLELHDLIKSRHISVNAAGCFEVNFNLIGLTYSALITLSIYAVEFLLYY
ncbi:hypothetical protein HUJ04_002431 [Dendroctonus ponderosae]|uniref:Gustatory receptor n=1 Tax=Dendroctonus ponderosae TaxID=77166 RepID=A0AAR5PK35_DENPD|nr:hypothetical protein HUJ04_002431 [Dendroctonus ponderosae]